MTDKIVILSTASSEAEAAKIAQLLIEERVAACVNIIPGIRSVYRWKDKIDHGAEWLLLIKTSRTLFDRVTAAIERAHSYAVPEVIALPILDGSANYLNWLDENLVDRKLGPL